jgi:predicted dehydrogenase
MIELNSKRLQIGIIGCGTFAKKVHIPHLLKDNRVFIKNVCTTSKKTAKSCQHFINCPYSTTKYQDLLEDPEIDAIFIYTRHDTHKFYAIEALNAQKYVYSEKPMALSLEDSLKIIEISEKRKLKYIVGFNRRYSPFIVKSKELLSLYNKSPITISYRISTEFIPGNHWIYNNKVGGGKIIGEGCHFFDTICFLSNSKPVEIYAEGGNLLHTKKHMVDGVSISVKFANGSTALINFNESSGPEFGKERIEIFSKDGEIIIDDFKNMKIYGFNKNVDYNLSNQDKGHKSELLNVISAFLNHPSNIISYEDCIISMKLAFKTIESLEKNEVVKFE